MSVYFVDTSALAKRYLREVGSAWVISWMKVKAGNIAVVSELAIVEMFSLSARRHREKAISQTSRDRIQKQLLVHAQNQYLVVPLDTVILESARQFPNRYSLRALDAIQLASALEAARILQEPLSFISADRKAASAEGFAVDDPNAHP